MALFAAGFTDLLLDVSGFSKSHGKKFAKLALPPIMDSDVCRWLQLIQRPLSGIWGCEFQWRGSRPGSDRVYAR